MKINLLLTALIVVFSHSIFAQTDYRALFYNGPGNQTDQACAITSDKSGNFYVTGNSWGGSNTSEDFATIKYNSSGVQVWVARYNGTGSYTDMANDIITDNAGNVYVTGWAHNEPGTLDCGTPDYITIKYNSSGVQQWVRKYNGPGNGNDYAYAIGKDNQSNIYVTGSIIAGNGKEDFATIKYNSSGVQQWVVSYDGPSHNTDIARSLIVDKFGNVYVTGSSIQTGAGADYVTLKYNSAGVLQWSKRYNGPGNLDDIPYSVDIDNAGNVFVTGGSKGSTSNTDIATIKYSENGAQVWLVRYNGPGNGIDEAKAIDVDAYGFVNVAGYCYNSSQNYNFVTFRYNPDGVLQWSNFYNGTANGIDKAFDIGVTKNSCLTDEDVPCFEFRVYVTGVSQGTNSQNDYLTIYYDEDGNEKWVKRFNSSNNGDDIISSIFVKDDCDTVYITGKSNNNYGTIVYFPSSQTNADKKGKELIELEQNYPNPFNPVTKIKFIIPEKSDKHISSIQDNEPINEGAKEGVVRLVIYNVLGKEIAVFSNNYTHSGTYEIQWDASDYPSGVYFYKLFVGSFVDVKKMMLIK